MRTKDGPFGIVVIAIAGLLLSGVVTTAVYRGRNASTIDYSAPATGEASVVPARTGLRFVRVAQPARTEVRSGSDQLLAVFTDGARTVRLTGPARVFVEPRFTRARVTTDAWIRLAPEAWRDGLQAAAWFSPWLVQALADRSPDVLAVLTEYLDGAPEKRDSKGVRYAGDAGFGPVSDTDPDGRAENNDFYDYLGTPWQFAEGPKGVQDPKRYGDVDCSGFLRLVYGYRFGFTLRNVNTPGVGLGRRAWAIAQFGPGTVIIPNERRQVSAYDRLQPGDLVFFDLDQSDGGLIDHSGIYLGVDDSGHHRFISSRCRANGPTFGDLGGAAILDGGGYFGLRLRTTRRL